MIPEISFHTEFSAEKNVVYLIKKDTNISSLNLSKTELKFLKDSIKNDKTTIDINSYTSWSFFRIFDTKKADWYIKEDLRKSANKLHNNLKENQK